MKQEITYRAFILISVWVCLAVLAVSFFTLFSPEVVAQEPTAHPTATVAATWTPNSVPIIPTPLPTFTPVPGTTPTPSGRFVEFRADDQEIELGECVLLSWVVRGDFLLVEFDEKDDNLEPVLVSEMDSREECPDNETDYELRVTWSDNSLQTVELDINVTTNTSGDGSSTAGSTGGGDTVPTPGAFVVVTPILITDVFANISESLPTAAPSDPGPAASPDNSVPPPAGILGTINKLPETGGPARERIASLVQPDSLPFTGGIQIVGLLLGSLLLFAWLRRTL